MKKNAAKSEHKSKYYYTEYYMGPVKIKDGLYIGDQIASKVKLIYQDIEFVITNKVTHIINCAHKKISNTWQKSGVQYLNFNWLDNQTKVQSNNKVLENKNTLNTIYNFIEEALENGASCLVLSMHGKSRSITVVASYLMKKYKWSLYKTLEFLNSKKSDLEIRQNFFKQLQHLQFKLEKINNLSNDWNDYQKDDIVLRNTFLNQKIATVKQNGQQKKQRKKKIGWLDQQTCNKKKIFQYIPLNKNGQVIGSSQYKNPNIIQQNKSILKHSQNNNFLKKNQITNISGNIINVTVNNFLNTQDQKHFNRVLEKKEQKKQVRPYSSDTKNKEKKVQKQKHQIGLFEPFSKNFKSPYEARLSLKTKSNKAVKTTNNIIKSNEYAQQILGIKQLEFIRNNQLFEYEVQGAKSKISKPCYYYEDKKKIITSGGSHKKASEISNNQNLNKNNGRFNTPATLAKQKQKEELFNKLNRTEYKWK